jgi:acyl-CoA dehydrogenase
VTFWLLFAAIAVLALAYYRAGIHTTGIVLGAAILFYGVFGGSLMLFLLLALALAAVMVPLAITPMRQEWISRPALAWFQRVRQRLDPAVLAQLHAVTAWWEAELFDGEPDWERFQALPPARALPTERELIDTLIENVRSRAADPAQAREYLAAQHAYGMGIAHRHSGLEWSAVSQAEAIARIAAIDPRLARCIAGPQRLAWIRLIQRRGTDAQQSLWLPALAGGRPVVVMAEVPAGDAVAAVARLGNDDVTALRLRLDARLADPAAPPPADALIGLLVQVRDPNGLLGGRAGVACLLVERGTDGLIFAGGRLQARGATVGLHTMVGGLESIGEGIHDWTLALGAAHALATPALHAGCANAAAAATGACARIHEPFAQAPGMRAAAQEALALVAGRAAAADALATASALAVDLAGKPRGLADFARSLSATHAQQIRAAAADVGLSQTALQPVFESLDAAEPGEEPAQLARAAAFTATVLRGHSAFRRALEAARQPNPALALEQFDSALWYHVGHLSSAGVRALLMGLTAGGFSHAVGTSELIRTYHRRINRYSAALAFAADVALTRMSFDLASRRQHTAWRAAHEASRLTLTTWLGDAAAQLWLACCALKHFEDAGMPVGERALLAWVCADALRALEEALDKVLRHLSSPVLSWIARRLIFPLGFGALAPGDDANRRIALALLDEASLAERLAACGPRLAPLAAALAATVAGEAVETHCPTGVSAQAPSLRIADAQSTGAIDEEQARQLLAWLDAVRRIGIPAPG